MIQPAPDSTGAELQRSPLRIVHVIPSYLPATRYGGPTYSVHGLCKALVGLGHHVQVFTTDADGPTGHSDVPLETPVLLDGIDVTYYRSKHLRRLGWAPRMRRGLSAALDTASVLHLHSVFMWPTSTAARIADRKGVPYILAPRGALVPDLVRRKSYATKMAWIRLVEAKTVAHAARLHVTSAAEYRDVNQFGLSVPPACLLPNGIDLPLSLDGHEPPAGLGAAIAAGAYAVFLGRISWIKGLDRALRALVGTNIRLLIAGTDQEGLRSGLEHLARDLGVAAQVCFVGHVDGNDKWLLLKRARFLILPSHNENFGNVVVEALSMGCPALVTPEVGAADVLVKSGGGLISPGDPDALRIAMLRLWNDGELRGRLAAAGMRYAREHLVWEPIAKTMVDCYRAVISERRG